MTDRDKLIAALIGSDPERLRLYRTSATFHHGLHNIAQLAAWAVEGVAADAAATDAEMAERRRLLERAPAISVPLESAGPLHGWSRAEDPGPSRAPRPDHPEDCPPECPDCAEQEAWDDLRDRLECDHPVWDDEAGAYLGCGLCDRCRI